MAGVSTAGAEAGAAAEGFAVHLDNFTGPFELLLSLIAKHRLDITEVSLSQVTDEFIAHIKAMGEALDLGETSEFLVVAATLLDLKAARLLPAADVEDEEDLALLEARDLLFARLLQYRAYQEAATWLRERMAAEGRRYPRAVTLEPALAGLLPEVVLGVGAEQLAGLAAAALAPRAVPVVSVEHLHAARVQVRDQVGVLVDRLRRVRVATFRALVADCPDTLHVVARFLALLELYREAAVTFDQVTPLGDLQVRWTGSEEGDLSVADEFDDPVGDDPGGGGSAGTGTDLPAGGEPAWTRRVPATAAAAADREQRPTEEASAADSEEETP